MSAVDAQIATSTLLSQLQMSIDGQTASIEETTNLIKQLRINLEAELEAIEQGKKEVQDTLFDDPFPLLKVLAPSYKSSVALEEAETIIQHICEASSPKEVILGLEELLRDLTIIGDEEEVDDGDASQDSRDSGASLRIALIYIRAYRTCLKRLRSPKLDKFYSTAFQTISAVITHIVVSGELPNVDGSSDEHLDLDLVEAIFELIAQVSTIDDKRQKQMVQTNARSLVETVLGLFNTRLSQDNANEYFLSVHPKYRRSGLPEAPPSKRERYIKGIWTTFFSTLFKNLDYKLEELLLACRFNDDLQRISSFTILAHYIALNPSTPLSSFGIDQDEGTDSDPSFLLSATLDTIRRSLEPQTAYRLSEDDILFFLWWCIDQEKKVGNGELGFDANSLYPLIEISSSLAALSPEPRTRFLAFRLLSTLVLEHCGTSPSSENLQLALLKQLLTQEDSIPSFRTACVGIAKEVLDAKFEDYQNGTTTTPGLFLSPQFINDLGPVLLRFDPPSLAETAMSAEEFVEQHQRDVSQKLNFYYFLLTRDKENMTGARTLATLAHTQQQFLDPLRLLLSTWLDHGSTKLDPSISLELELLETSLSRVDEVIKSLPRDLLS
ncbi:hypothetical protein JCM5350_001418 [Sporobolomyces pararoseus]